LRLVNLLNLALDRLSRYEAKGCPVFPRNNFSGVSMKFIDLNELENSNSIETDFCIVGSGPAGTTIAKEFAGSGVQVLLVEGGGLEETPADKGLFDVENVGAIRTTPQDQVRNRVIGGSSHSWNGRCTSFDDIDFETRAWIPYSGWPISNVDLDPFLERSRKYLGLGPNIYDDRLWKELGIPAPSPTIDPALLKSQFWQYSRDERNSGEPTRFARAIAEISAANVRLLMHANATQINTNKAGTRIKSLEVRSLCGRRAEITANVVVLACGGLENARLLLASNRLNPNGVGNSHDLVGRFLMDHPGCTLGRFDVLRSSPIQSRLGSYFLDHEDGRQLYAFGLTLSPEIQRNEQLLNCAAFLEPTLDEPWQALKRLVRPGAERHYIRKARDLSVVIGNLPSLLYKVYRRVVRQQPLNPWTDETSLYCLVEQAPDASSRVTLAQQTDALGVPLLRIDWRIGELERRSVIRLNELIELELRRVGLPEHSRNAHLFRDGDWRSQFIDRAHPLGTTRMSDSPKQGVVNRNCMVHEVAGLYIAGSSVFPTAGHANPTLMIVALAIRLADWLKHHEFAAQHS
jgi:choline dehydrogenase-like flavoprotein